MRGNNLMIGFDNDTPFDDSGFPVEVCVDNTETGRAMTYVQRKDVSIRVRNGRGGYRFYCGECGRQLKAEYCTNIRGNYNYCPTCGSRLFGKTIDF